VPSAVGLAWLLKAGGVGFPFGVLPLVPGAFLFAAGVGMLLYPGDRRLTHFGALGGALGMLLAIPGLVVGGPSWLALGVAAAGAALACGHHALRLDAMPDETPELEPSLAMAAEVAFDEAVLGTMVFTTPFPYRGEHARIRSAVDETREQFAAAGWLEKPEGYHETPPPPDEGELRRARSRGVDFEHLSFPSEYEPREREPGRERWLAHAPNREAHAWVVRGDESKPWLVCIHGYRMGTPWIDLGAFRPDWLHQRLGLNLILPILPLHGPRKIGARSGDGYLGGDLLDTLHAEAQAAWDLRRALAWVRARSDAPIGVYGLSLGGYNAALLASLDPDLACAIAGIPASDFTQSFFHHGGPWQERAAAQAGLARSAMWELLSVVSPLVLTPKVPHAHRAIFGGLADRIVPPEQVRDLWRHWERPPIEWYPGAHLTFGRHPRVRRLTERTLRGAGLCA
jgi:dienelactone hydrolase